MITDSHFSERNREGRLLSFLSKISKLDTNLIFGIGVDEKTSMIINDKEVLVSGEGHAIVYKYLKQKNLNFGPIKKFILKSGEKYPQIKNLQNNYSLIQVKDGVISDLN